MPADELLVLIVRDAGLRGALIAQLSLAGEQLVTFDGPLDDEALDCSVRPPAILITDDDKVALLFDDLAQGARWLGFIYLAEAFDNASRGRMVRVSRAKAAPQIRDTLAAWRAAPPGSAA